MQSDEESLERVCEMTTEEPQQRPDWFPHPDEFRIPTGEELRSLRERSGLSQAEVADRVECRRHTLSNWERGETSPAVENAEALLECYQDEME